MGLLLWNLSVGIVVGVGAGADMTRVDLVCVRTTEAPRGVVQVVPGKQV